MTPSDRASRARARVTFTCTILAVASCFVAIAPAYAQTSAALGKPLPSSDLAPGTVSVRVIAGAPSTPVTSTEVTLIVNGATRIARTDAGGRAHFKDLPPNAQVQAKVLDEDKQETAYGTSEQFTLPADQGVRLMISTLPWKGTMAGEAGGGAGGAMPNPRAMSGEPRPEANDAPGTFTVRLSYDDFKDAPPVDVPVALVGYAADGKITTQVVKSDKEGRAKFEKLDRTGATSYFAMTQLPRNSGVDRLTSTPAVLDARAGVRLILSSEKRASTAAPVDDLAKLERQDPPTPAGKVRVVLEGGPDQNANVLLIDAEQKLVVGTGKPAYGAPDPSEVQAQANFDDQRPDIPAKTLRFNVQGGAGSADAPLAGVKIRLTSAANPSKDDPESTTDASGLLDVTTTLDEPVIAVVTINGKTLSSKPLDLAKQGGALTVLARWPASGKPEVVFDFVPRAGQVVYAETQAHGQTYRSLPFQPVPDRGTRVTIFVLPRIMFSFSLTSRIDDKYLAVNGRFELSNYSWAPYVGGPDGLTIPLPRGFTGGLVAEKDQSDVALTPGEGFRIVRPIPPGDKTWHGAFSVPVDDGTVSWSLDLPFGAFNSGMEILQVKGMRVDTPEGVNGQVMTVPQGTYYVLPQISILPKQSMVMSIYGLPAAPAWRVWVPRIVGVCVVLLLLGGIAFALMRKPAVAASSEREARRQKLLDELVELERDGKNPKRREQIMAELEKLWDDAA